MTYVIGQPCVDVMDRACVEGCPVDCIYEGARSLYIYPGECIDCGVCGFAPERRNAVIRRQIGLRNCPFLDLIADQARVTSPVHLGLMQGVMSALGASGTVEWLDPFAKPGLCLAQLGSAPAGRS